MTSLNCVFYTYDITVFTLCDRISELTDILNMIYLNFSNGHVQIFDVLVWARLLSLGLQMSKFVTCF